MRAAPLAFMLMAGITLNGCSTRQVSSNLDGASAQRLVSHSIEKWVAALPPEDFVALAGQPVWLQTHFVQRGAALAYSRKLLQLELRQRFGLELVDTASASHFELHVFFNSLGTDADYLGLSLPFVDLRGGDGSRIDLLSLNMYHGITEGFYMLVNRDDGSITRSEKWLARIRTDSLSTPVLRIPISNMK